MDYTRSSLLNVSPYFCHGKSVEELGQSWLCITVELQSLKMQAQAEIRRRDEQLNHVKELLYKATKERDEAVQKCQTLKFERLVLRQQVKEVKNATFADPVSRLSSIEDEPIRALDSNNNTNPNNNFSSSDCDDQSIVSSPATDLISTSIRTRILLQSNLTPISSNIQSFHEEVMERLLPETANNNYPLPEKGKLLEAVMNAGPLLQTLLLAGPLPQWRHPPPPLESFEIPPVTIIINNNRTISKKRALTDTTHCSDS